MNKYYWLQGEPQRDAICVRYHTLISAALIAQSGWQTVACQELANFICELGKDKIDAVHFYFKLYARKPLQLANFWTCV